MTVAGRLSRLIVAGVAAMLSGAPSALRAQPAADAPAQVEKPKAAGTAKKSAVKGKAGISKRKASTPGQAAATSAAGVPSGSEPKSVAVRSLPGPIVALHNCAPVTDKVEMLRERYAKSVLFFVSCPAQERGGYQLQAVYAARDIRGRGAKRLVFEVPDAEGNLTSLDMVPSAIPARETFVERVEERDVVRARNDPPWITGAWRPEDRAGICAVVGHWRVQDGKAELWLWEEAKECPKDAAPRYESRIDKKPPALVGR